MESEFEKNLHRVKPKGITQDEKHMLWSNITESIKAEEYIKAHKVTRSGFFNMFAGVKRLRYIIAAILTGTLISGTFATAAFADNSRPGDLLFPIDLAVENIQLRLAADDGRDELRIQFASERLEDLKQLLALANINYDEVLATEAMSAVMATGTASTSDSTATTTDTTNDDSATTTDSTSDDTTSTSTDDTATTTDTTTNTDTTSNNNDDTESSSDEDDNTPVNNSALTRANNAFLVALQYLENSRAALVADGNDNAVLVMDAFIAELTVMADNHVDDIKKSRIVIDSGPNNSGKVKIAIKASIDDVETKFNFQESTSQNGGTSSKVALQSGNSTIKLNVVDEEYEEDQKKDKYEYKERKIDVCYEHQSKEVSYDEISKYIKKGAKLGDCDDDDKKYYVCHNGKTLHVGSASKKAHLGHGDYYGKCSDGDDDDDNDEYYYVCYNGETKKVDDEGKYKYMNKGATRGKCSDQGSVSIPSCVFNLDNKDIVGRTVYDFSGEMIRSDQNASDSYTNHKDVTLEEGKYKVTLMSYDGYVGRENKSQPNESWHITFWDISENNFQKTNDVSDIPDNIRQKTVIEVVDEAFVYDGNADELYAEHSSYKDTSSPNSVKVICAAFDKIEENGDTTPPVISNITSTPAETTANVSWNTDENSSSKVWYGTGSNTEAGGSTDFVSSGALKTAHLLTLNDLSPDTTYYYLVESSDSDGNKTVSSKKSFKTDAEPDTTAPSFTGIAVNAATTSANIAWTTNEITTGTLYYLASTSAKESVESTTLSKSHGKEITGLSDNTEYYYQIVIEDASGNVSTSTESSFTTLEIPEVDETAPVVSNLTKEATTTEATVSFDTDEAAESTIWYSTISPVPIGAPSQSLGLRTSHSYTITSLLPETTYYFLIETEDEDGNSSMESQDSFTTTAVPIPADTTGPIFSSVYTEAGTTTALLSFSTNENSTSMVYYDVSPSVDVLAASSMSQNSLASFHEFNFSGLTASTTYYFLLTATDETGNVSTTSEDVFETL